jgi:serine protease Do
MRRAHDRPTAPISALLVILSLLLSAMPAMARDMAGSVADLAQRVLPAVVNIYARKTGEPGDPVAADAKGATVGTLQSYYGSGFIIDPDGLIVTNRHVIAGARQLVIGFADGSRALGTVIAAASEIDLALVKVTTNHPLAALKLGDSAALRVGDPVLAIGNPLGVGTSVSAGIVSALNRNINDTVYDNYIQTDAAINHGNSGGPLIDAAGEVVGVNTALYSDVSDGGSIGLGFAMPSNDVKFVVARLLKYHRVRAGWIGVSLQDMSPLLAMIFDKPDLAGAIVTAIVPGSPAAAAGIVPGDVIRSIDAAPPTDARDAMRDIGMVAVGAQARLGIWHDGAESSKVVVAAEIPGSQQPLDAAPDLNHFVMGGLQLSAITPADRQTYGLSPQQAGVLVTGVPNDVFTGERGLLPGDVILRVQDTVVSTPQAVHSLVASAWKSGHALVALLVQTKNTQSWIPLGIAAMKAPTAATADAGPADLPKK